ncbi:unnamed protein product [Protopolystoma xenopodis]|uniref:Uncharacterized protein n=1 Tax=Protopolystoma xenopodis TaxID=117903 RepID=A0A3S5BMT7_9PLAT|nr:unnamed protein product [Protopolystoma xenopodis]
MDLGVGSPRKTKIRCPGRGSILSSQKTEKVVSSKRIQQSYSASYQRENAAEDRPAVSSKRLSTLDLTDGNNRCVRGVQTHGSGGRCFRARRVSWGTKSAKQIG